MTFLFSALAVALAFGLVIFVHEFGHFIVAKKIGVKVERFSFGLGPELVGFQWGETRYCLAWIPLGGEVRMAGEMGDDGAPAEPKGPRDFFAQPWYRRVPIVLAGPAMNYVLAFLIFASIALVWGDPRPSTEPVAGDLVSGYPAQLAGLQPGDRFLSAGGRSVSTWMELAELIHASAEKPLALEVRRGEKTMSLTVTPLSSNGVGLIGISPATVFERAGPGQALLRGVQQPLAWSLFTLKYLGEKIVRREKPDLSGPVGIANVIAKAAQSGLSDFLFLIAMISVGIGLFNLFPIPLLDGGHLMFFIWEGIAKRPASRKAMAVANTLGLTFLLSILVFATYSDVQRLRAPKAAAPAAPTAKP